MTIVEFLTARLDEDEALADATPEGYQSWTIIHGRGFLRGLGLNIGDTQAPGYISKPEAEHIVRHDPAHVLADIAAKRAIIAAYQYRADRADEHVITSAHATGLGIAVHHLASVYADHADYDPGWKS